MCVASHALATIRHVPTVANRYMHTYIQFRHIPATLSYLITIIIISSIIISFRLSVICMYMYLCECMCLGIYNISLYIWHFNHVPLSFEFALYLYLYIHFVLCVVAIFFYKAAKACLWHTTVTLSGGEKQVMTSVKCWVNDKESHSWQTSRGDTLADIGFLEERMYRSKQG